MKTWESGRESALLNDIITGRKTIEGRLNRGKFADYRVGDRVWLRRDYRDKNGVLQNGEPRQVLVEVTAVRLYRSALEMVEAEGFQRVIPNARNAEDAAAQYNLYYPLDEQKKYGMLGIEIVVIVRKDA